MVERAVLARVDGIRDARRDATQLPQEVCIRSPRSKRLTAEAERVVPEVVEIEDRGCVDDAPDAEQRLEVAVPDEIVRRLDPLFEVGPRALPIALQDVAGQ